MALSPSPRGARVSSGESNCTPPPNCGPHSNPGVYSMGWVYKLLVGSLQCSERFFSPGSLVLPFHQKPTWTNSNSTGDQVDKEQLGGCAICKSLLIYLFVYLFKSYSINFCEWCNMLLPASPCSSDHRIVEQVNKSNKQHQGRLDSGHFWGKQGEFSKKSTNPPPHNVGLNPPHGGSERQM